MAPTGEWIICIYIITRLIAGQRSGTGNDQDQGETKITLRSLTRFNSARSTVRQMEVLKGDSSYILFLDEYSLKKTNGTHTNSLWLEKTNNNPQFYNHHGINLNVPSNFHQFNSSITFLAYNRVYCLFALQTTVQLELQKHVGLCNTAGSTDGAKQIARLQAIKSIYSDATSLYILENRGQLRQYSFVSNTLRSIRLRQGHPTNRVPTASVTLTSYQFNPSRGFVSIQTKKPRSNWSRHEIKSRETTIAVYDRLIFSLDIIDNSVFFWDKITLNWSTVCNSQATSYEQGQYCMHFKPKSLLLENNILYIGGQYGIYSYQVIISNQCERNGEFIDQKDYVLPSKVLLMIPLSPGIYLSEVYLNQTDCKWYFSLEKLNLNSMAIRCDIEDTALLPAGTDIRDITVRAGLSLPVMEGTYSIIDAEAKMCDRKVTVIGKSASHASTAKRPEPRKSAATRGSTSLTTNPANITSSRPVTMDSTRWTSKLQNTSKESTRKYDYTNMNVVIYALIISCGTMLTICVATTGVVVVRKRKQAKPKIQLLRQMGPDPSTTAANSVTTKTWSIIPEETYYNTLPKQDMDPYSTINQYQTMPTTSDYPTNYYFLEYSAPASDRTENRKADHQKPDNHRSEGRRIGHQGFTNLEFNKKASDGQTFENELFENQRFGNQRFEHQRFGNPTFDNQRSDNQVFGNQSFGHQNFGNQRLEHQRFDSQRSTSRRY